MVIAEAACRRRANFTREGVAAMDVGINSLAYNSLWQVRSDAWSSLEESSSQLSLACAQRRPAEPVTETVSGLLDTLGPVERFWAFPGPQAFQQLRRAFAAAKYERFAALVRGINQALVSGSYRAGAAAEEDDGYDPGVGQSERGRAGGGPPSRS
jgi:arginine decarboxylase